MEVVAKLRLWQERAAREEGGVLARAERWDEREERILWGCCEEANVKKWYFALVKEEEEEEEEEVGMS